jgi:hypothetical protein
LAASHPKASSVSDGKYNLNGSASGRNEFDKSVRVLSKELAWFDFDFIQRDPPLD